MSARSLLAVLVLSAPAFAAPVPAPGKADDTPAVKARKVLDESADFQMEGVTLAELAGFVKDRFGVEVVVDQQALLLSGMDPGSVAVTVTRKGCKLRDGLRTALAPLGLRHGVTADGLVVSTEDGVIQRQLRQPVSLAADIKPLAAVVKGLADQTGANLVLDPRAAKKAADAAVTLTLDDVPLETAVRLAAEVGGFRAVRLGNVLFVTTEERAKVLREDADGPTQPAPGGGIVFPGIGAAVGGVAIPPPPARPS